jgi:hypothetical protein
MSDENTNVTEAAQAPQAPETPEAGDSGGAGRALGITALAVVSAAIAFLVVRKVMGKAKPASDPTAARIQALMDEANRLLKELDAKKLG